MHPTLRTRLQLELLKKLREKKNPMQKGFTLVELMIVVAVIGILSAVALPAFLGARNAAAAGSAIGEATGFAKECAAFLLADGLGSAPTAPTAVGIACAAGSAGSIVSRTFSSGATGLRCLNSTIASTATQVTIAVPTTGVLSCS